MNGPNETDYVAYHGNIFLQGCVDSHKTGLRIQIHLEKEDDYTVFKSFKKHRKGKAGSGLYRAFSKRDNGEWTPPVDLRFITWSLTSSKGAVVTFEIDDKIQWGMMRASKAIDAGYRVDELNPIEMIFVELDQEGKPVNVEKRAKLERYELKKKWPKGGPQSKRAARLCRDPDFKAWVLKRDGNKYAFLCTSNPTPEDIAHWMRDQLKIDTRAQLDHDPMALQGFEDRIMKPFLRSQMH